MPRFSLAVWARRHTASLACWTAELRPSMVGSVKVSCRVSTAVWAATSPAWWPPTPSATAKRLPYSSHR